MGVSISPELEGALNKYHESAHGSVIGAENAWRGYWLQALYIAERVANRISDDAVYLPETVEDLQIVTNNSGDAEEHIELIQVKSMKKGRFSLSDLKPKPLTKHIDDDDSFFGHLYEFWNKGFDISARVVVFGDVGREMSNTSEGLGSSGPLREKLIQLHGYPEDYCEWLKGHLAIERASEPLLRASLIQSFGRSVKTAAAVQLACDYVMNYIYACCRDRARITKESWEERLTAFGLQASSARGYLENYGHSIVPLAEYLAGNDCDRPKLESAFRAGASAKPEHIVLGLDVRRSRWECEISSAFEETNVVVVRASSGQGKTTLCYRWLFERNDLCHIYLLNGVSLENASGIAAALRGLAANENAIYAYIEAGSNAGWVELCEEIRRLNRSNIKLLASVREDDAARAGYDPSIAGSTDIFLRFDRQEASHLYQHFDTPSFPSFESAWKVFGGNGPLMEFVYSLTHKIALRQRLEGQVKQLRKSGNDGWLTFLYLASVAGEYGLPSSIRKLKEASGLSDVQDMLEVLEDEMLLRSNSSRELVFPLHPYRSKLLAEIIFPKLFQAEEELVLNAVECANGDFGPMLIPYLSNHTFSDRGIDSLAQISEESWSSSAQVIKAMVWKDANRFSVATADIRHRMRDLGIGVRLLCILSGPITERGGDGKWESVLKLIPDDDTRKAASSLVAELANRQADYTETDRLIVKLAAKLPSIDLLCEQASDAGFVLAYIGERGFGDYISDRYAYELAHFSGFGELGIDNALNLLVGYNNIGISVGTKERSAILARVCQRDGIVWLNQKETIPSEELERCGERIIEFPTKCFDVEGIVHQVNAGIVPLMDIDVDENDCESIYCDFSPNSTVMRAVCDLRRLFSDEGRYCVEYVGIRALLGGLEIPDCEKRIPEKYLKLNWTNLINRYFIAMCGLEDGIASDWNELERLLMETVSDSVEALEVCTRFVKASLGQDWGVASRLKERLITLFNKAKEELDSIPVDYPKCARDPYAFSSAQIKAYSIGGNISYPSDEDLSPAFGASHGHDSIFVNTRIFLSSLQNHFNNVFKMMQYTLDKGERPGRVAMSNIAKAYAKIDSCNNELLNIFGKSFISDRQKKDLLRHAVYWNYLWCRGFTERSEQPLAQRAREMAIQKMPERLLDKLREIRDVEKAEICADRTISIHFDARSELSVSKVILDCIKRIVMFDLDSDECFLEWWLLHEGIIDRIDVTFILNDRQLSKKSYLISDIITQIDDVETVDDRSPIEILFDVNNPCCVEEAELSLRSLCGDAFRLKDCLAEVRVSVFSNTDASDNAAYRFWEEWQKTASSQLINIIKTINKVANTYPLLTENYKSVLSELELLETKLGFPC